MYVRAGHIPYGSAYAQSALFPADPVVSRYNRFDKKAGTNVGTKVRMK